MSKPKTESSIRTVPVNSWLLELITELKANDCDFVFGNPLTGFPPTSQAINQALRRFLKQGNMKKEISTFTVYGTVMLHSCLITESTSMQSVKGWGTQT